MAGWSQGEICNNKNAILPNKLPLGILFSASGVSAIYSGNVTKEMGTCFLFLCDLTELKEISSINFFTKQNSSCSDYNCKHVLLLVIYNFPLSICKLFFKVRFSIIKFIMKCRDRRGLLVLSNKKKFRTKLSECLHL